MIDYINKNRSEHIITIEDPVEYVYESGMSVIHQREIGVDTKSFAASLRSALREDPDVILVGEMRDYETISRRCHRRRNRTLGHVHSAHHRCGTDAGSYH